MTTKNTNTTNTDHLQDTPTTDGSTVDMDVLREKLIDALIPGFQVEFDPDEAEHVGAFVEDALSEQDAMESSVDLAYALEEPAFLDDDGPSDEIPPFISTTNVRELYDLRPGETVSAAIARCAAKGN